MKVKNHILNLNRERSKGVNKVGVPLDKNERVKYFHLKEPRVRPQNLYGNRSFLVGVGVI